APQQRKNLPGKEKHQDHPVRRLPGPADDGLSDGGNSRGSLRFVSGLAENTNSIFCADSLESQTANGCPVLQKAGTKSREAQLRNGGYLIRTIARSLERAHKSCAFLLTKTYMDARLTLSLSKGKNPNNSIHHHHQDLFTT